MKVILVEEKPKQTQAKEKKQTLKHVKTRYIERMNSMIENYNSNGKKTIAIFCDTFFPFVDGVINVMDNYAKRLQKEFNVVVCVPRVKKEYIEKEYPVMLFKSVFFDSLGYCAGQPSTDTEFKKMFKQLHIDLIHIHSPFMVGRFALKEAKKRDIPSIATFHSQFKQDFEKIVKVQSITGMLVSYIMEVFNGVDEVWTMNEASRKTLLSYKFKGKCRIITNATDFTEPENLENFALIAKQKFNITNADNVYCFVGRLVALKNIVLVAESLAVLKSRGIPFKMIYVGDGQDRPLLENAIKKLKLEQHIILTGKVMDKPLIGSILYNSKIMLFPSVYDTDGIVKYEAAAFGTPTLFLKNSNASYDIVDGETGFICEGDPVKIADKLEYLYKNPEVIERVGENAKKYIYHTWDDVIDSASKIYNEFIEKSERQVFTKKQKKRAVKKINVRQNENDKLKKKIKNKLA